VKARARVLVVEDDAAIRRGLVDALRFGGFEVSECSDGREGLQTALAAAVDLALLDVVLPGLDGFEILGELRRTKPELPVILVTARGAESDRVRGLSDGADDYVVKPFSARELLARVEAVLRRSSSRPGATGALAWPGGGVDFARREVRLEDGAVRPLSEKEQAILLYLAGAAQRVVSREELLERVWGLDPRGLETRTVDMHVARLREKMKGAGDGAIEVIATVRGRGYNLAPEVKRAD
jgi:DNA-binding response OmpR family regulator